MYIRALDFTADINGDGTYSLWEIWELLGQAIRAPGNLLIEGLGNIPPVAGWLGIQASAETGYSSLNGLMALIISLVFWVALLFIVLTVTSPESDDAAAPADPHEGAGEAGLAFSTHPATAQSAARHRAFLPVSRTAYAAPGTTPKRRRHRASADPHHHTR